MRATLYQKCIDEKRLTLLTEWAQDKNDPLTPWTVYPGSKTLIWWRCEKGHEWQAPVYSRWAGHGCPVCASRQLRPGTNDLATANPALAAEWDPEKNGDLTPDLVFPYSTKRVWWRCEKGHEWQATVKSRVKDGSGCPICANKSVQAGANDLATLAPEIAAEWHPTKNGTLTPRDVVADSHMRAWWRCEKGHEWRAQIMSRVKSGCGCPVCAGKTVVPGENDLATYAPAVADEWHPTKNNGLTPQRVRPQSNRTVWWQCEKGHEWRAAINTRVSQGNGCPYCASRMLMAGFNDLATLEPRIAAQWDEELNGPLTPQMVMPGSHKKVWWRCAEDHVWLAAVYSRTGNQRSGCPVCAGVVGKKRLARMRELEASARLSLARRVPMMPERYIPTSTTPPPAAAR